ncbi:MAG: HD domain-containing protein [Planctomycetales bacterium]|nr:HD domain-containing protein [Planctomycetales bacterium]
MPKSAAEKQRTLPIAASVTPLAELSDGQEADFYAVLSAKIQQTTRDGKPYDRVTFRDAHREVSFPIWSDAPLAAACRDEWTVGEFYKLRAVYRETTYGPQLDIRKIRAATEEDRDDGFDPALLVPSSRFDPQEMFAELTQIVAEHIGDEAVRELVTSMLEDHRDAIESIPAATHNHHAHRSGFVEHVLSVTKTCVYLADKYTALYPDLRPPLDKDLVVAGGVLHDIGKLRELQPTSTGAEYTPAGTLIGHILQGRDMLREAALEHPIDDDKLLRLEHIIVAHQRLPEWGAPKPPMTPEALLVHYADDIDAKLQMMVNVLTEDATEGPLTSNRNALRQKVYRGEQQS